MDRRDDRLTGRRTGDARPAGAGALTGLIPLVPLWAGTALTAEWAFPCLTAPWWAAAAAGLLLSAALLTLRDGRGRRWVMPAGLAAVLILCLVSRGQAQAGLRSVINDALAKLTQARGRIYLARDGAGDPLTVQILLTALLSLLYSSAAERGSLWPALPAALALAAGTAYGVIAVDSGWALTVLGLLLLCGGGLRSGRQAVTRAAAAAVCVLAVLATGLAVRNADLSGMTSSVRERMHAWRYDTGAAHAMPEGRLAGLGPLRAGEEPALEVTMERPQKLYLRGHVYDVYTGSSWESVPGAELAENAGLFYWLHEGGFYGQSQTAAAVGFLEGAQAQAVTVRNLSACRENAYLPVAFADSRLLDASLIGDTRADPSVTEFTVFDGSVPDWYAAQYALASGEASGGAEEYLTLEQGYREYVTEKDVQMTQECWNELYRMLGDAPGRRSLYEIQQLVRDWIEQNLRYDERAYTVSGDGDFLRAMLTGGGAGYSVHYATAAALLLRYYGVPARYVEGYYLTPEQASEAQAGQSVVLTEKNAHALAEYYLNGVGFVPFEVTPGYVDPEDLDLGSSQDGTGGDRFEYESAMSYAQTEEPDVEKPERGERDGLGARALWALLLIPLAALALLARRRLMLRRALRRIERSDDRDAVAMRYGYAMALKARCGDPELPGDVEAARLNLLALFSTREITAGDRAEMDAYAAGVLAECRKRWSFGRKLRLRLIDAVY